MGRDKATLPVGGVAMARRVADGLAAAGAVRVVAAGGDAAALEAAGLVTRPDSAPGGGPLPAVIDALEDATVGVVLVVGCDLVAPDPAAMATVVAALVAADGPAAAVPVDAGVRQWHHAAWRRTALEPLRRARASGVGSLRRATARISVVEVHGLLASALADADTPADLPDR